MNFVIISGSSRGNSESRRVADYLLGRLEERDENVKLIDLHETKLSLDPEDIWDNDIEQGKIADEIKKKLEWADGFIVVSPEWGGMASPALKNFFIHTGGHMAHKAALLTTVSSGRGGAYPIAELRASSYKNVHVNYIPEHLIVRGVNEVLHGSLDQYNKSDAFIRPRIEFALDVLQDYTKALSQVREAGRVFNEDFKHGM
ncbi:MAG: NAD(P)H-dependent oxidoreductase [bacterium]|nr:NAD(P)H-dependent oxidoreductase [bacterium]